MTNSHYSCTKKGKSVLPYSCIYVYIYVYINVLIHCYIFRIPIYFIFCVQGMHLPHNIHFIFINISAHFPSFGLSTWLRWGFIMLVDSSCFLNSFLWPHVHIRSQWQYSHIILHVCHLLSKNQLPHQISALTFSHSSVIIFDEIFSSLFNKWDTQDDYMLHFLSTPLLNLSSSDFHLLQKLYLRF